MLYLLYLLNLQILEQILPPVYNVNVLNAGRRLVDGSPMEAAEAAERAAAETTHERSARGSEAHASTPRRLSEGDGGDGGDGGSYGGDGGGGNGVDRCAPTTRQITTLSFGAGTRGQHQETLPHARDVRSIRRMAHRRASPRSFYRPTERFCRPTRMSGSCSLLSSLFSSTRTSRTKSKSCSVLARA